jgi:elongation of very long chain fatty acids protein 4
MTMEIIGETILTWFDDRPHHALHGWPFVDLRSTAVMLATYALAVKIGCACMMGREAIKFPAANFTYNLVQIALCAYMTISAVVIAVENGYAPICNRFVMTKQAPMARLLWLFYMSKYLDFCDTFFIVAGKKWRQLSFLHVYHHMSVAFFYWINSNVNYDGDIYLTIVLNAGIHFFMYLYYFVSTHTPDVWWKKYLTLAQICQFVVMMAQAAILVAAPNCSSVTPRINKTYFLYVLSMFALFVQFYVSNYKHKKAT